MKIGTSTLTTKEGLLNTQYIFNLAKEISSLRQSNHAVLIISSGTVRAGKSCLFINGEYKSLREK